MSVEAVLVRHRRLIEAVATTHAANPNNIPDIVQNVAVKLCQRLDTFQGRSALSTWIFRVVVNEARMVNRAERCRMNLHDRYESIRQDGLDPAVVLQTARARIFARAQGLEARRASYGAEDRRPRLVRRLTE